MNGHAHNPAYAKLLYSLIGDLIDDVAATCEAGESYVEIIRGAIIAEVERWKAATEARLTRDSV